MTTKKTGLPSLISYLDHKTGKFYLKISMHSGDPAVLEKSSYPFMTISESGPVARIIDAQFMTNAGSEIKRVFLLVQKDEYHFAKDELWPVNNRDIDQSWQKAFALHSGNERDDSVILLSDQINDGGELLPFQPLFFCKLKQVFFHPLCPECGSGLQQCYDDGLLTNHGLQPYSTSTRRYLFCPSCLASEGKSDFYAAALEGSDPPTLKNCLDLIKGFGKVGQDRNHPGRLPCKECPTCRECYGTDCPALARIVPFSFYPFYLLIFDAMTLSAGDFLSLVSGASFEELETRLALKQEPGRIKCLKDLRRKSPVRTPFFFDKDDRYFLEVLHLKMSFLGELAHKILPELCGLKFPDFGISLDRIWVKLADQGGMLPFFWNFKVKLADIVGSSAKTPSFPKIPSSYGLYFLGLLWFYALLTNNKQDISVVYGAIGQITADITSDDDEFQDNIIKSSADPVFSPENIFWNPDAWEKKSLNDTWMNLWNASLGLGWSLLRAGLRGSPEWSTEAFWLNLEKIGQNIKDNLFRQGDHIVQTEPMQENKVIHDILARIMQKWQTAFENSQDVLDETKVFPASSDGIPIHSEDLGQGEEDVQQTVILSSNPAEESPAFNKEENGLDDTVILSPASGDAPGTYEDISTGDEDLPQTVILPPDNLTKDTMSPAKEEDELEETVILSPEGFKEEISPPILPDDGLDETVILWPDGLGKGESHSVQTQTDEPEEDDFLEKTVILKPEGAGEKK